MYSVVKLVLLCGAVGLGLWTDGALASPRDGFHLPWSTQPGARRFHDGVVRHGRRDPSPPKQMNSTQLICDKKAPVAKAPKDNIWGPLTDVETAGVLSWLFQQKDLNLTARPVGTFTNLTRPITNESFASLDNTV
jgi:hypothetical protein